MVKKIILFLVLLFLSLNAFAGQDINFYAVPATIPLNQEITATGVYYIDNNAQSGSLCSFYFLDSTGVLIDRASDQYTTSAGRFAMQPYLITEPDFIRGSSYTLRTECGTAREDYNFQVIQKQEVASIGGLAFYPQSLGLELNYWLNAENSFAVFMLLIIIAGIIIFGAYYLKAVL